VGVKRIGTVYTIEYDFVLSAEQKAAPE